MYLLGTEASESADQMELDHAESLNQQLLAYLSELPDGTTDPRTAAVYHQLGSISLGRWQLAEAGGMFSRSLEIIEKGEDRAAVADDYYSLGRIRHLQRRYSEAKDLFRQALGHSSALARPRGDGQRLRALGLAAQYRFELDEAGKLLSKSKRDTGGVQGRRDGRSGLPRAWNRLPRPIRVRRRRKLVQAGFDPQRPIGYGGPDGCGVSPSGAAGPGPELFYEDAEEWYLLALENTKSWKT